MKPIIEDASTLTGAVWRKASASTGDGNCVELASLPGGHVAIRHSKEPNGPAQVYTPQEWAAFRAGLDAGEFDHLAQG